MQVFTSLQSDNHASTPPLSFLQAGCPSCHPTTSSVKALKVYYYDFFIFTVFSSGSLVGIFLHGWNIFIYSIFLFCAFWFQFLWNDIIFSSDFLVRVSGCFVNHTHTSDNSCFS